MQTSMVGWPEQMSEALIIVFNAGFGYSRGGASEQALNWQVKSRSWRAPEQRVRGRAPAALRVTRTLVRVWVHDHDRIMCAASVGRWALEPT